MKKALWTILFCTIANYTYAQGLEFMGRFNGSIGANYETLDYNGGSIAYSPGGGMGLEIGAQYDMYKGFYAYGTLGLQYNLALQLESGTNGSNKSSFTFSRTFLTVGINKSFKISENTLHGIVLGAGVNYNIPGKFKIIENDVAAVQINYDSEVGFHFDIKLQLKLSDSFFLEPGLRYRKLELDANSFESIDDISALLPYLQNLNTSGVEISVTIVKKL